MLPTQGRHNGNGAALLHLHEDGAALQAAEAKGGKEKPRNEEALQACLSCSVLCSSFFEVHIRQPIPIEKICLII